VSDAKLIDYYAVLNLPPKSDLSGVENAYARLSDDLEAGRARRDRQRGHATPQRSLPVLSKLNSGAITIVPSSGPNSIA